MQKRFLVFMAVGFAFILCGCEDDRGEPKLSVKFSRPAYDDFSYVLGVIKYNFEIEYRGKADMGLVYMETFKGGVATTDKMHITGVAGWPKTRDGFTMQMSFCILDSEWSGFKVNTEEESDSGRYSRISASSTYGEMANGGSPRVIPYEKFNLRQGFHSKVFKEFDCSAKYIPIFYIRTVKSGVILNSPLKNGVIEVDPDYDYLILYLRTQYKKKAKGTPTSSAG